MLHSVNLVAFLGAYLSMRVVSLVEMRQEMVPWKWREELSSLVKTLHL